MAPLKSLAGLSLAVTAALGFQIHYYQGQDCHGAPDGTVQISLANNMCSTEYMGVAQSAIVEREDGDSLNDAVFWSGADNCDISNVVAQSNGGICVDFSGEFGEARSFEVISGEGGGARKVKKSERLSAVTDMQAKAERRDEVAAQQSDDETNTIVHGDEFEWDGKTYKWHQIYDNTWSGVLVEEWDDNVNAKNDEVLPDVSEEEADSYRDADSTDNPQRRALMELDPRSFRESACNVVAVCSAVIFTAPAGLKQYGNRAIDRAATVWNSQRRKTFWAFLNTPFVSQAVTVGGSGFYFSLATKQSSAPTNCSTTGTSQGTLKDALAAVLSASGDTDSLDLKIELNGKIYEVNIQAQPKTNHSAGQCGARSPNP